mmetsp:Transcript_708/g.2156  ORF Transcript_708/g.2156 Transcript_708/m.2156 type:complete len:238 (+) Transcript_708:2-715(+)
MIRDIHLAPEHHHVMLQLLHLLISNGTRSASFSASWMACARPWALVARKARRWGRRAGADREDHTLLNETGISVMEGGAKLEAAFKLLAELLDQAKGLFFDLVPGRGARKHGARGAGLRNAGKRLGHARGGTCSECAQHSSVAVLGTGAHEFDAVANNGRVARPQPPGKSRSQSLRSISGGVSVVHHLHVGAPVGRRKPLVGGPRHQRIRCAPTAPRTAAPVSPRARASVPRHDEQE